MATVIATADAWTCEPFGEGMPLPFEARYSEGDFARLRKGLVPSAMEDKWFVYYEAPYLFFHRSWTGQPVYRIALEATGEGAVVAEALWASEWAATENADAAYQTKLLDFLISNLLLGQAKPFPRPEGLQEPARGAFQHHIAGTGYREAPPGPKKPWWRFW